VKIESKTPEIVENEKSVPKVLGAMVSVSPFFAPHFKGQAVGEDLVLLPAASEELTTDLWDLCHWFSPVHHMWPTDPLATGFVEKAVQGLFTKFSKAFKLSNILCYEGDPRCKSISQNLRGRALQVFEKQLPSNFAGFRNSPTEAPSNGNTLWIVVHAKGVIAGVCTPREAGNYWPAGRRYVSARGPSRAGGKWVEFAELSKLFFKTTPKGHWLELGSAPGGVTAEMIADEVCVTAVDRAAMDATVLASKKVHFLQTDATSFDLKASLMNGNEKFHPRKKVPSVFQGVFCDMNAEPMAALNAVCRALAVLDGPFGVTLKLADPKDAQKYLKIFKAELKNAGAKNIISRHLWHNRSELCILGNVSKSDKSK
jgi:23S rRNA U2552 (ribose-2'-O)-methylase RlmE/FtsJ